MNFSKANGQRQPPHATEIWAKEVSFMEIKHRPNGPHDRPHDFLDARDEPQDMNSALVSYTKALPATLLVTIYKSITYSSLI
jgi:hypothetical protein